MVGTPSPQTISTKQLELAQRAERYPHEALSTLAHFIDLDWLREAYRRTRKDGAPGVDGQVAAEYEADLETNLSSLLDRFKSGRYRAPPVKRVYIPKGDGKRLRPIGIPTLEDKVLQRAVVMILEPLYEQQFLDSSYGFRPGRSAHQALDRRGWLTAGVTSSIAWPQDDVWINYDSVEYLLHGARQEGDRTIAPCISTPSMRQDEIDQALSRLYRLTSVLGFYKRGYVDITGSTWGSHMIRYANARDTFTTPTQAGTRTFSCNHMPIIESDQVRKALAFLREGRRLERVHEPYSFLSFFKVIESQFKSEDRIAWVEKNLGLVTEERAVRRITELRSQGINVNEHLFDSGRCAVAHASVSGNIVDPDIPADRKRIGADLDIIAALANRYIKIDAGVPDEMDLYATRDRTAPWHALMTPAGVAALKGGGHIEKPQDIGRLEGAAVSVRLWPDPPAKQFEAMTLLAVESGDGVVKFITLSPRGTIVLVFAMDVAKGRVHTLLNEGGMRAGDELAEQDVEDYTRYFHSIIGNRTVELTVEGAEPVDCEVVIPVNIIPRAPEEAVAQALEQFRQSRPPALDEGQQAKGT